MAKVRNLNTETLNGAVRDYAGHFLLPSRFSRANPEVATYGRDWVMQSLYNAHYKDEHDYVVAGLKGYLGQDAWKEFDALARQTFEPRSDDVLEEELATRLAIRPDGSPIPGKLGTVEIGRRPVLGADMQQVWRPKEVVRHRGTPRERREVVMRPVTEPVFAGDPDWHQSVNALNMNISAEIAIAALDALVDHLDSDGTGDPVIQGRTGAQPADPDVATTGTLLFTLAMTGATAFGAAADQADGTIDVAAGTIADDTSADATGTLGYLRCSSSNDGSTPLDDHIDGEAGTSGADFNFNTVSIQSGATVSMTSWTITLDQGTTAT